MIEFFQHFMMKICKHRPKMERILLGTPTYPPPWISPVKILLYLLSQISINMTVLFLCVLLSLLSTEPVAKPSAGSWSVQLLDRM